MHAIRAVSLALLFVATTDASLLAASIADPVVDAIRTPSRWTNFDWSDPTSSTIWTDPRWKMVTPEDGDDSSHRRDLDAFGQSWSARLRKRPDIPNAHVLTLKASVPARDCLHIADQFGAPFGDSIFSDQTIAGTVNGADLRIVMQQKQWTVGTTRLDVFCVGGYPDRPASKENVSSLLASFWSVAVAPLNRPDFLIRCESAITAIGDATPSPMPELVFRVDTMSMAIKNQTHGNVGERGSVKIDDDYIHFAMVVGETKATRTEYDINRLTGAFRGDIAMHGKPFAKIVGRCDPVATAKKF